MWCCMYAAAATCVHHFLYLSDCGGAFGPVFGTGDLEVSCSARRRKFLLKPSLQVGGDMKTGRIEFPRVYEDVLGR